MIDRREIVDAATALGLNPHVVEKDYVLGWLLWGIYSHEAVGESWLFKGGTCLKNASSRPIGFPKTSISRSSIHRISMKIS